MSFVFCEQILRDLDDHLCYLLLMMIDFPLAIHHKKWEYICRGDFVIRGRFCVLEFGAMEFLDCI